MIKTIILDDHKLVCDGLEVLLNESKKFEVIAKYSNGKQLLIDLDATNNLSPDLLLCDIDMPHMRGFEVLQRMRLKDSTIKIVILSMHDAPIYSTESIQLGANAYINKSIESSLLIETLLNICSNTAATTSFIPDNPDTSPSIFSPKETAILKKIMLGKTSEEIAQDTGTSILTVKTHRKNMLKKLNVNNTAELISKSVRLGLL